MKAFTTLTSRVAPLLRDDVDTDQIIPAKYLKVTDRSGLAEGLFAGWRADPAFVLHQPPTEDARVLLAGRNFGCGSSREHAPWALLAAGFRCVVARSFADIFRGNALRNGLLTVALAEPDHARLSAEVEADPWRVVSVDLEAQRIRWGAAEASFEVDPFSRTCLLEGLDPIGYLLSHAGAIDAFEERRGDATA
ncbi:MAG: 3-isopropylmalate dehydratase small subunit [Sandaracinaceae bacterium]